MNGAGFSGLDWRESSGEAEQGAGWNGKDSEPAGELFEGRPPTAPFFPIAPPAALALCIRLPLAPERKPVIVPGLGPSLGLSRVVVRPLSGVCRHCD